MYTEPLCYAAEKSTALLCINAYTTDITLYKCTLQCTLHNVHYKSTILQLISKKHLQLKDPSPCPVSPFLTLSFIHFLHHPSKAGFSWPSRHSQVILNPPHSTSHYSCLVFPVQSCPFLSHPRPPPQSTSVLTQGSPPNRWSKLGLLHTEGAHWEIQNCTQSGTWRFLMGNLTGKTG